jgi:hypothetical protein
VENLESDLWGHCVHNRRTSGSHDESTLGALPLNQDSRINPMDKRESPDKQQPLELIPDFLGEDRHEFVAKLAYKLWEERGRPFGSPEVDWFRAERAVYSSLVASGLVTPSENNLQDIAEKIYR